MTVLIPPGNFPDLPEDPTLTKAYFGEEFWPALWPRLVHSYASAAARDADLPGLAPTATAFAWLRDVRWLTVWTGTAWRPAHPVGGVVALTFNSSGLATITHNLGFIPALFTVAPRMSAASGASINVAVGNTLTATTAQVVAWNTQAGAAYSGGISSVQWLAVP